jgi:hypothetical protein
LWAVGLLALASLAAMGASEGGPAPLQPAPPPAAPSAPAPDEGEASLRRIVLEEMPPEERVEALERFAIEHPKSAWCDDAIWMLGEAARQQGRACRVVYYWQYLMGAHPDVRLEEFTRSLAIYRASGLPQVTLYLELTGKQYVRAEGTVEQGGRRLVDVRPLNPVPAFVWAGLASSYEAMGRRPLAARAWAQARDAMPAGSPWRKDYEARLARLQRELPGARAADGGAAAGRPGGPG